MSWELTIVNAEDRSKPLGERGDVIARVAAALPGVVLQEAPGPTPEMIAKDAANTSKALYAAATAECRFRGW